MSDVTSIFETYKRTVLEKDVEGFVSIFDDKVRIFDMWKWEFTGLDLWRKMAEAWFGSLGEGSTVVSFEDIEVRELGDMAYGSAYARFSDVMASGEELRHLYNRLTWVLEKKNGKWKVIHEHTSGPAEHETLKVDLVRPAAVR